MSLEDVLHQITENQQEIDAHGQLDLKIQNAINYKFRLDWNYYSNAMEGNLLTRNETKQLMMDNVTIDGKSFKDIVEMRGHDNEVLEIFKVGTRAVKISEKRIQLMHKAIMHEDDLEKQNLIGRWKIQNNYLHNYKNEKIEFLNYLDVPEAMHKLVDKTNSLIESCRKKQKNASHPALIAFEFHLDYINIHPFYDGNGRTCRLLMNLILINLGLPPIIIKDKTNYYKFLAEVQKYGAPTSSFHQYMAEKLLESQRLVLDAIAGKDIEEQDDIDKEIKLWKKELMSNDENLVVEKSNKFIGKIYEKSILPIISLLNLKLIEFEELFTSVENKLRINEKDLGAEDEEYIIITYDHDFSCAINEFSEVLNEEINQLEFNMLYKGFKRNGVNPFDLNYKISVALSKFNYTISNNEIDSYKKLYSEVLTENEMSEIVNKTAKRFFFEIKQLTDK
jgi:Fic family protein